jgi:hypothetical protein
MSSSWIVTTIIHGLGIALAFAATGYTFVALWAVLKARRMPDLNDIGKQHQRPVTVLKPLHGAEPRLYENLRSFCLQQHPDYQLVFGVRDPDDPPSPSCDDSQSEFPQLGITLVIDPRVHGANFKVSNLLNMLAHANYDWLVLADADISVPTDYSDARHSSACRSGRGHRDLSLLRHSRPIVLVAAWTSIHRRLVRAVGPTLARVRIDAFCIRLHDLPAPRCAADHRRLRSAERHPGR